MHNFRSIMLLRIISSKKSSPINYNFLNNLSSVMAQASEIKDYYIKTKVKPISETDNKKTTPNSYPNPKGNSKEKIAPSPKTNIDHEQIKFNIEENHPPKLTKRARGRSFNSECEDKESYWPRIQTRLPELVKSCRIVDFNTEDNQSNNQSLNKILINNLSR